MFANNYISTIVENQLPDFIRADHPAFVSLIKKYYEYLEQEDKTLDVGKKLYDYMDVDSTRADLVKYFKSQIIPNFPDETELSQEKIIKAARDFYSKKGTPESFKFLFRVLYNQEIDVFFPKQDILKASDGKWKLPQALRLAFSDTLTLVSNGNVNVSVSTSSSVNANGFNLVTEGVTANSYIQIGSEKRQVVNVSPDGGSLNVTIPFANPSSNLTSIYDSAKFYKVTLSEYVNFDVNLLERRQGVGEVSRTTCTIEKAFFTTDKETGREIVEVYVSNVKRLFDAGENLVVEYTDENGNPQTFKSKIISVISNITLYRNRFGVVQTGRRYKTGDPVVIFGGLADTPDATKAVAYVNNVSTGSIESVSVTKPGYFFRADPNSLIRVISTSGIGANVLILSVWDDGGANSENFEFNTDALVYKKDILLNDEDGYDFDNVTTFTNLADIVVAHINLTTGAGNTVSTVNLNTATYTASTENDYYKSLVLQIIAGTGSGSSPNSAIISSYNGTTKIATLSTSLGAAPDSTSNLKLFVNSSGNTTTTVNLNTATYAASSVNDYYKSFILQITDGTGAAGSPNSAAISSYSGTTKVATLATALAVAPDATSNVRIFANAQTEIGRAMSFDTITLGKVRTLDLKDGGSFFEEPPTFDAISLYETDYSGDSGFFVVPSGQFSNYNRTGLPYPSIRLNSSNSSYSLANGFYNGTRLFLDVGDTAHYAEVVDYVVTNSGTSANVKTLYLDRAFENNINQINILNYNLFFDFRPKVSGLGKIGIILVNKGGSGYSGSDSLQFVGSGYDANGTITVDGNGSITAVTVDNRGEGYSEMPSIVVWNSTTTALSAGTGAEFEVIGLSDGEEFVAETSDIGRVQDFRITNRGFDYANTPVVSLKVVDILTDNLSSQTIVLERDSVWQGGDTNANASFRATVDGAFRPNTTNTIIRVFNYNGSLNTSLPLKVNTTTGNVTVNISTQNATVLFNDTGLIPAEERRYPYFYGDGLAKANAEFLRGLIKYNGFYLNTDGHLSADKKLQNKDYYHNFSYELQTEQSLDNYKETVFRVAHPAGMHLLSRFLIKNQVDEAITLSSNVHTSNSSMTSNANTSYSSNILYGNNETATAFTTTVNVGDIIVINTTETASLKQYARVVTSVVDANTIWLESSIGGLGDGRIRTVSGNANVFVYSNTSAVSESIEVGDNISFNISGIEYRREVLDVVANVVKLNATSVSTNTNILYSKTPIYNVVAYSIIKTHG